MSFHSFYHRVAKLLKSTNEMFHLETKKDSLNALCFTFSYLLCGGSCCPYLWKLQAAVSKRCASLLLYMSVCLCSCLPDCVQRADPVAAV